MSRAAGLRRLAAVWALAVLTHALAGPAWAGRDFDPQSADWNGLATLLATAARIEVELSAVRELDWSTVSEREVLLIVGPVAGLVDPAPMLAFLSAGGRLILADDFRAGASWAEPLGIELLPQPGRAPQTFDGNPAFPAVRVQAEPEALRKVANWHLPRARLTPPEFLAHNLAKAVVLNHPAALRVKDGANAVLWGSYGPGELGWLAEAEHESGRALVVADSSLLLNQMLTRVYENRQFAANLLRYYCVVDRPCKVRLLASVASVRGQFVPTEAPPPPSWRAGLDLLQKGLKVLAELLRGPLVAPGLVIALVGVLALLVLRRSRLSAPELPPRGAPWRRSTTLAENVGAWLADGGADYRKPARLLAAQLTRWLQRADAAVATPGGGGSLAARRDVGRHQTPRRRSGHVVDDLVQGGQFSPQAGERMRQVLSDITRATSEQAPVLTRRQFGQLAAEVEWAETLLRHTTAGGTSKPSPPQGES